MAPCSAASHRSWVTILARLHLVAAIEVENFDLPNSWQTWSGKAGDISGFAPTLGAAGGEKFPVFVWLTGTGMSYWTEDDKIYTQEMAARGFVAASVDYPSRPYPGQCNQFGQRAAAIFDPDISTSAISAVCAHPLADCSKGVAVSGFSQGANLANLANDYNNDVRAALLIGNVEVNDVECYDDINTEIPSERVRSIMGEFDGYTSPSNYDGARASLVSTTGYDDCNAGAYECLRSDGSGWIIVGTSDTTSGNAGHCFQYGGSCISNSFDMNYYPNNTTEFGLKRGYDWLANSTFYGPLPEVCGDGSMGGTEICDETDFGGLVCSDVGNFDGGTLGCNDDCTYDTSGCTLTCGNGNLEGSEECDTAAPSLGDTCISLGFDDGDLGCSDDCTYDTSGCTSDDPCASKPRATGCSCEMDEDCDSMKCRGRSCKSGRRGLRL